MEQLEYHLNTGKLVNKLLITVGLYIGILIITIGSFPEDMKVYFQVLIWLLAGFFIVVLVLRSYLIKMTANPNPVKDSNEQILLNKEKTD